MRKLLLNFKLEGNLMLIPFGVIGLGLAPIFPAMIHAQFGKSNHKADIGLGQAFTVTTRGSLFSRMPISCGYRFEPKNKRYYVRASYTPIISYLYNFQWIALRNLY